MKLSNDTYDFLKWIALVFIPALDMFTLTVGKIWGLPYYVEVAATVAAIGVFLGALLGVSSHEYHKEERRDEDDAGEDGEETESKDR